MASKTEMKRRGGGQAQPFPLFPDMPCTLRETRIVHRWDTRVRTGTCMHAPELKPWAFTLPSCVISAKSLAVSEPHFVLPTTWS